MPIVDNFDGGGYFYVCNHCDDRVYDGGAFTEEEATTRAKRYGWLVFSANITFCKKCLARATSIGSPEASRHKIRVYLRKIDDYAMHDYGPIRHMHVEVEAHEVAQLLREKPHPWYVIGVELPEVSNK